MSYNHLSWKKRVISKNDFGNKWEGYLFTNQGHSDGVVCSCVVLKTNAGTDDAIRVYPIYLVDW